GRRVGRDPSPLLPFHEADPRAARTLFARALPVPDRGGALTGPVVSGTAVRVRDRTAGRTPVSISFNATRRPETPQSGLDFVGSGNRTGRNGKATRSGKVAAERGQDKDRRSEEVGGQTGEVGVRLLLGDPTWTKTPSPSPPASSRRVGSPLDASPRV